MQTSVFPPPMATFVSHDLVEESSGELGTRDERQRYLLLPLYPIQEEERQ